MAKPSLQATSPCSEKLEKLLLMWKNTAKDKTHGVAIALVLPVP